MLYFVIPSWNAIFYQKWMKLKKILDFVFFGYIYGVEYYTGICSVSDYIAALKRLRCENLCSECIEQDVFYYRGEPHDYGNTAGLPSINRGDYLERDNESELFRECERRLPEEFANCRSTFEKLVKMQHYGVKTRLLDISQDPLQALFFPYILILLTTGNAMMTLWCLLIKSPKNKFAIGIRIR